jgi:hypothetical protein
MPKCPVATQVSGAKSLTRSAHRKPVTHINKKENFSYQVLGLQGMGTAKNTPRILHRALHCMRCFRKFTTIRSG